MAKGSTRRASGSHALTPEDFARIVDAYRASPGKHYVAAKAAGVNPRTAKKAWELGLPYDFAKTPIRDIVEREQTVTRQAPTAAGASAGGAGQPTRDPPSPRAVDAGRERHNRQAQTRSQEAVLVQQARANVLTMVAMTSKMLRTIEPVWAAWCGLLAQMKAGDKDHPMNPGLLLQIMRAMVMNTRDNVTAAETLMDLEKSTGNSGELTGDAGELSLDDAAGVISKAQTLIDRARRFGVLPNEPLPAPPTVAVPVPAAAPDGETLQ